MAKQIPNNFQTASPILTNYDWTDVNSNLGYIKYYGTVTNDNGAGIEYNLLRNIEASAIVDTQQLNAGTTTQTYNTPVFAKAARVKGAAYLSFGYETNTTGTYTFTVLLRKVAADATITDISSTITLTLTTNGDFMALIKIPLTSTTFGIGDNLRMVITFASAGSGGDYVAVGHDPQDRDGSWITPSTSVDTSTIMSLAVPYKIVP